MREAMQVMTELIRSEVFGIEGANEPSVPEGIADSLYELSSAHDLAHIVSSALEKSDILPEGATGELFKKKALLAVHRYSQLNYEYGRICRVLDENKIAYIPLKGSVIRDYYPKRWQRTSCDIDILVHEEELWHAEAVICEALCYSSEGIKHFHDISLFSKGGIHLELHYNITERLDNLDGLLLRAWEYASPVSENSAEHRFTNEYLMFHLLAHMSNHFIRGGCGVRPFIDLHLLRQKIDYNDDVLRQMCRECNIEIFYDKALMLSDIWFGDGVHDDLTQNMEDYILGGGAYGTYENKVLVEQEKRGGKFKYIIHRIFMPYKSLKSQYPILKKHKWLLPVCWVRRWFRMLFKGRLSRSLSELKKVKTIDNTTAESMAELMQGLGL